MSKELMQQVFTKMQTEMNTAHRHTQKGELIEAEAIYHKMLEQQENFPPALHGLSDLADKINEQDVREDLLQRAIDQIKGATDRNRKGLIAIWLAERAEALIKLGRQDDAKGCISESERIIKENLA